ncbi:MAG: hypothetical protein JSS02_32650 [Planctomycetes bacterium]|nr:hypothetical protein [Planctomycetota bacterium]
MKYRVKVLRSVLFSMITAGVCTLSGCYSDNEPVLNEKDQEKRDEAIENLQNIKAQEIQVPGKAADAPKVGSGA